MKVSELSGAELDYWVAKAENLDIKSVMIDSKGKPYSVIIESITGYTYNPTSKWSDCGPLIKKFGISLDMRPSGKWDGIASKSDAGGKWQNYCDSPQQAICRAVVASVYGEDVSDDH